jgi:hypothetical protein
MATTGGVYRLTSKGLLTIKTVAPLRSRFQARLRPGVAMTSNVKSWLPMDLHLLYPLVQRPAEEPEPGKHDG